jgi:hypothetical protein
MKGIAFYQFGEVMEEMMVGATIGDQFADRELP